MSRPWGRVAERFLEVAVGGALAALLAKTTMDDGLSFIDSLIWLTPQDWLDVLKAGIGTALLPALLKLQRELGN